jgi:hypothetical protein
MARTLLKATLLVTLMSIVTSFLIMAVTLGISEAAEATEAAETVEVAEPVVSLAWFLIGGMVFAVFAGGGLAELIKRTWLARLKAKAKAEQERMAEESGFIDVSKVSKPWWWVGLLGVVALTMGAFVVAVAAPFLGYPAALGMLVGGGGGVNATWLWKPVQKAIKAIVGALKGKFTGGGDGGE